MVLSYFVTVDQNCGTPFQQRLRSLKMYTTLRKILLNGAYRVNVMCSLYNDIHDILPPPPPPPMWNLSHYFIRFIYSSVLSTLVIHPSLPGRSACAFVYFFFFYQFHVLYTSFDDMHTKHQLCCNLIGIFGAYICMYLIYWACVCVHIAVLEWILYVCTVFIIRQ